MTAFQRACILFFIGLVTSEDVINYNETETFYDEELDNDTRLEMDALSNYPTPYRQCPFEEDDPCECSISWTSDGVKRFSVVCSYMDDHRVFPAMMTKMKAANATPVELHSLFVYNSKLELPHVNLFDGLPFRTLRVVKCNVSLSFSNEDSRSPDKFRPLLGGLEESLEEADFRGTNVPEIESRSCVLGSLSKLTRFSLTNSGVSSIPREFFCCSYLSIKQVYLYSNEFRELPAGGLSRATNLKIVILNDNQIFVISRNFFPSPANYLEEIHLRSNRIQTLPSDFFQSMPLLRYIDLSENLMEVLPPDVWSPTWSRLLDIYLTENNLICDCTFRWLISAEEAFSDHFKRQRFLEGNCQADGGNVSFPISEVADFFVEYTCE